MRVVVSIPPQAYFVQRIAGERVEVDVLVGPGQNPHTFSPTHRQMARLSEARAYFRVGVPFEQTVLARIAEGRRGLRVVDTHEGPVREDPGHAHAEGELDPHTWLSPRLATISPNF